MRDDVAPPQSLPNLTTETGELARDFVKVEKNLSSMGFFTPSKSRGKVELREKVMVFRREEDGKVIETTATILPSAKYGLPTTADQDKFFAFQKIVNDLRQKQGRVENPVGFTSKEMLDILGIQDAGNNYIEVHEWLQRMTLTGIHSKGVVYLAKRRLWASDTFHVFDRVVAYGMDLGNGQSADRNYVWLSDWQLENINNNYLIPVDLETYRQLRGNIAKALVPLLQMWLYASRNQGQFEKRYEDLCTILDIKRQTHLSQMRKQLGPSLDELVQYGYLSDWSIEPTFDGRSYKVVAEHGAKFFTDQRIRLVRKQHVEVSGDAEPMPSVVKELLDRGIGDRQARQLLKELPEQQPIRDQLDWIDHLLVVGGKKIKNPPGFYIALLRENVQPPLWFVSKRPKQAIASNDSETQAWVEHAEREERYRSYKREQITRHIDEVIGREEFDRQVEEQLKAERQRYPNLTPETLREIAAGTLARNIESSMKLMEFADFCQSPQLGLFS
jgi:Replication initiator protein A